MVTINTIDQLLAALDAATKYITGEQDQMKVGTTLKNVGPTMKYKPTINLIASISNFFQFKKPLSCQMYHIVKNLAYNCCSLWIMIFYIQ